MLWAWFPGQEAGHALGDVLAGRTEPSGRLPWTLPANEADVPVPHALPDSDMRVIYTDGVHVGYRGWERSGAVPAAPFGHGLGWTTWSYDSAKPVDSPDGAVQFAVTSRIQGHARAPRWCRHTSRLPPPCPMGLTGPCAGSRASLASPPRLARRPPQRSPSRAELSRCGMHGAWVLPAGDYTFEFGRSIRDPRLQVTHEFSPVAGEEHGSAGEVSTLN